MGAISKKEIKKRMLIKQTINAMNKQIAKLEEQKQVYINAAREAKERGLAAQYELALSGLKMTIAQQKRIYEMKLNFEITSQMKDMTAMTTEFLRGMSSLSKDMMRLTKEKEFRKTEQQFAEAMAAAEMQTEHLEAFMDSTQSAFATGTTTSTEDTALLEGLIAGTAEADTAESADGAIEAELANLKKQLGL